MGAMNKVYVRLAAVSLVLAVAIAIGIAYLTGIRRTVSTERGEFLRREGRVPFVPLKGGSQPPFHPRPPEQQGVR